LRSYINVKSTILVVLKDLLVSMMSEEEKKEDEGSMEDERQKLAELGVENTWELLSSGEKKKKEIEKKPFIGFS